MQYTKPSMLWAAAAPAMAALPKLLMVDCTTTLATLNTMLCTPVGRPTVMIRRSGSGERRKRRISRCRGPCSRTRMHTTIKAAMPWLITVARPTPATLISNTITKIRLSTTFTRPEAVRQYSGRRVSPTLRKSAAPKL